MIADNTWAAFQGRKSLNVVWDNGPNESYDSDQYKRELQETARTPGSWCGTEGDVDSTFAKGGKTFEADYYVPLLAHAPMEPLVALAELQGWQGHGLGPTQNPQAVQDIVSKRAGHPKGPRDLSRDLARRRVRKKVQA